MQTFRLANCFIPLFYIVVVGSFACTFRSKANDVGYLDSVDGGYPTVNAQVIQANQQQLPVLSARIRGSKELSNRSLYYLSELGFPHSVAISSLTNKDSISLESAIVLYCGNNSASFQNYLLERARQLNDTVESGYEFGAGDQILMPFCLDRGETEEVLDKKTCIDKNNITCDPAQSISIFKEDSTKGSRDRIFSVSANEHESLTEVFLTISKFERLESLSGRLHVDYDVGNENLPIGTTPISFVFAQSESVNHCGQKSSKIFQENTTGIYQLFKEELELSKAGQVISPTYTATHVGLIDTGIPDFDVGLGKSIFNLGKFIPDREEINSIEDDDESFGNDIYGFGVKNIEPGLSPKHRYIDGPRVFDTIRYFDTFALRWPDDVSHGSRMASIILGVPGLESIGELYKSEHARELIQLKSVNFSRYDTSKGKQTNTANELVEAIDYLRRKNVDIISLSLETLIDSPIDSIEKAIDLANTNNVLVVTAAGNKQKNSSAKNVRCCGYPAALGGIERGLKNLVTVGSYDSRTGFDNPDPVSKSSKHSVDIFAPGCAIQTLSFRREIDSDGNTFASKAPKFFVDKSSNTSPATAYTTKIASLIHFLFVDDPETIKTRLVIGSDYKKLLEKKSSFPGVLNPLKAISIRRDVIHRIQNGKEWLAYVTLSKNEIDALFDLCGNDDEAEAIKEAIRDRREESYDEYLLKIVPNLTMDFRPGKVVRFWYQPNQSEANNALIKSVNCTQKSSPQGVFMQNPVSSIQDVTFRSMGAKRR